MKLLIAAFIAGIMIGMAGKDIIDRSLPKMQAKHPVGSCVSNGLYVEEILEIRTSKVLMQKEYVVQGIINGKRILPDVTAAWIVDENSVLVNSRNCETRK